VHDSDITAVIIGGTSGIGRFIAERYAGRGDRVVVAGRDADRAAIVAKEIGGDVTGIGVDLSRPDTIADALAPVTEVDHLIITAIHQSHNTIAEYKIEDAIAAATVKVVGYAEAVRALRDRFTPTASVVLFGGFGKERPYPGSTVVTTVNGAITGLMRTLAVELAPHRVNAIHPGAVGDSPRWRDTDLGFLAARALTGRTVTMAEIADATEFLLRNTGVDGQDLYVEGGLLLR
jgi:NAD(P)-dependent dehydrogenase (short-subunit alcohol dehydrogenase family)